MAAPTPRKLQGIQALRGVAALAVVAYHAARHVSQVAGASGLTMATQPGHAGVDLFFVLSGFIILHVHRGDIGHSAAIRRYAWQRFARLMPIYWVALAATAAMMLPNHGEEVTAARVALSASLLPTAWDPLLGVAWTLQHEMLFYCAFALLILNRALGLTCLALWLGWGIAQAAGLAAGPGVPRLTSLFNLQFLFGMIAALAVGAGWMRHGGRIAFAAAAMLLAVGAMEAAGRIDGYGDLARFAYGIPSALLVAGLASWEQARPRSVPGWLAALGEASYSVYLFHLMGIGIAWQFWSRCGIDTAAHRLFCFAFLIAGALVLSLAAHRLVEAPLLRRMRGRTRRPRYAADIPTIALRD